jgi:hypothetical protein
MKVSTGWLVIALVGTAAAAGTCGPVHSRDGYLVERATAFSPEECKKVVDLGDEIGKDYAESEDAELKVARSSSIVVLKKTHPKNKWIYKKLEEVAREVDNSVWKFGMTAKKIAGSQDVHIQLQLMRRLMVDIMTGMPVSNFLCQTVIYIF